MEDEISLIIITADKQFYLLFVLYNLSQLRNDLDKMEIIIVDNGETNSLEVIKKFNKKLKIRYFRKKILNRSIARNIGAYMAKNEVLFFLDDDIIIQPDFFNKHLFYHDPDSEIVVIGNTVKVYAYITDKKYSNNIKLIDNQIKKMCQNFKMDTYRNIFFENLPMYSSNWIGFFTSNISLKKKLWDASGGFDENFMGWGFEDLEYAYRLVKKGGKLVYARNIISYHMEHTKGKENFLFELQRNIQYFYEKYERNSEIEKYWDFFRGKISLEEFDNLFLKELSETNFEHIYSYFKDCELQNL